jgi:hypothetical protein
MYGGRVHNGPELSDKDLTWMYDNGIGYRIPISSLVVDEQMYKEEKPFLEKHHRAGNSVIVVKDSLAKWIKNDFPLYSVECSVIKEVDTKEKLLKTLEIYDTVVPLPEGFNSNKELLMSLPQDIKDRIRLFLTVGCAYNCPSRVCYGSVSRINRGDDTEFQCSQKNNKYVFDKELTLFNMEQYINLGIKKFKVLRTNDKINNENFF